MSRRRFDRQPPSRSAWGDGDGFDPRFEVRHENRPVANRKALQLCRQVERTLSSLFAGACGDDVLADLLVQSVVPAPSSARLLVTVSCATLATPPAEVMEHLHGAVGLLRREVAASIHRRKTPELVFRGIPG